MMEWIWNLFKIFGRSSRKINVPSMTQDEKYADIYIVRAHMDWASSFILLLPVPVCLIDKKGFLHHSNDEFTSLINITLDGQHCPYIGRFFNGSTFREALEKVVVSDEVLVIPLNISWLQTYLKSFKANENFEWTLSGNAKSEAVVITARYPFSFHSFALYNHMVYYRKLKGANAGAQKQQSIDNQEEIDKQIKVEKYKKALEDRKRKMTGASENSISGRDPLTMDATQKWNRFIQRCNRAATAEEAREGLIPYQMKGFVEVITTVANNEMGRQ